MRKQEMYVRLTGAGLTAIVLAAVGIAVSAPQALATVGAGSGSSATGAAERHADKVAPSRYAGSDSTAGERGRADEDGAMAIRRAGELRKERRFEAADALLEEELQACRARGAGTPLEAAILQALAELSYEQAQFEQAGRLWQECLDIRRKVMSPHDPVLLDTLEQLAKVEYRLGRMDVAKALYAEHKQLRFEKEESERQQAAALHAQGVAAMKAGRNVEAIARFRESLKLTPRDAVCQQNLFIACNNHGISLYRSENYAEAEAAFRQALSVAEQYPSITAALKADAIHNLASTYHRQGRFDEARRLYMQAIDLLTYAKNKQLLPRAISNYNDLLSDIRRVEEMRRRREALRQAQSP